ncbi:MAG TPA: hypothetical protein VJ301_10525 [Propionibacteriaceae bacterium]|nr:hypothetical protein [Propionibacteriaceae bacterium]
MRNQTVDRPIALVTVLCGILALLAAISALVGLLATGGPGRHVVTTARGVSVTVYGQGIYAADSWLIGAGNRGQDLAILLVEVPFLLLALRWYRGGALAAATVLTGVLAFFSYYYVSATFATAQNRLFPLYVAAASLAGFALVVVVRRLDSVRIAAALPDRPGRKVLAIYLLAVAAALTLAWLPDLVMTTITGDIAAKVGPYTSSVTDALDLGLVVPVAVIAAVQLLRRRPEGIVLALVMLVVNVCIGILLMAQGVAQLASGVPMTIGEIIAKMLTFAVLTLVAGGLLIRMARAAAQQPMSVRTGS